MKIKTTTEKEIEVTFPQYKKYGSPLYQLVNENSYIGVRVEESECGYNSYDIEVKNGYESTVAMIYNDGEEVTKAAFDNAYQNALSKMCQLIDIPECHDDRVNREDRMAEITAGAREDFALNWREGK